MNAVEDRNERNEAANPEASTPAREKAHEIHCPTSSVPTASTARKLSGETGHDAVYVVTNDDLAPYIVAGDELAIRWLYGPREAVEDAVDEGDIVLLSCEGGQYVRRVEIRDNQVMFTATNPAARELPAEHIELMGVMLWLHRGAEASLRFADQRLVNEWLSWQERAA